MHPNNAGVPALKSIRATRYTVVVAVSENRLLPVIVWNPLVDEKDLHSPVDLCSVRRNCDRSVQPAHDLISSHCASDCSGCPSLDKPIPSGKRKR